MTFNTLFGHTVVDKYKTYHMVFTATAVEHAPQKQLGNNAAQGPHVDGCGVGNSQDDLGSPFMEEKLNVSITFSQICTKNLSH